MKRIIYLLAIVGTLFMGCNPIEDINNDIDAQATPIAGSAEYTLTSDDYDDLGLGFGSFSSEDDAKSMLPPFLSGLYPTWGEGSAVVVGYELFIGSAEGVSDYSGADVYQLSNADYATSGSDAFGFYPNVDPDDFIPDILDAAIAGPAEGDIVLAKYDQYFNDPEVGLANVYEAIFPANYDDFENIDELGDEGWFSGSSYAGASGFDGSNQDNEDWFISPQIDLTGEVDLKFQIRQRISFLNGAPHEDHINILVSTDYTTGGDQNAATWDTITLSIIPSGDTSDFITSEDYDFSAYDGQMIHMAFKFETTVANAPLWRIESFAIKTLGVDGDANNKGTHFVYDDGEWEPVDGVYFLSSADFDSMGEGSGQPGRFDNFGSSTPAEDYLPTFLSLTSPWAFGLDDDEVIMVYDYFSSFSGAQIRANRYTKVGGEWTAHLSVISTTLQFGHNGTNWVPDNTIRYTFVGADYSFIIATYENIYPDLTANMATFGNFNGFDWTDEQILEVVGAVLLNNFPSAAEGQQYIVTYSIFDGSTHDEDISVILEGGVYVLNN